jgi:hypothetical protein
MVTLAHVRSESFEVTDRQKTGVRAMCIAIAVIQLAFALGLYRQAGWATGSWPLADVRMTCIFLAAIAAATAAALIWVAWRNELGALEPVGLDLMVIAPALGSYLLWVGIDRGNRDLVATSALWFAIGVLMAVTYWWSRRVPLVDPRSLPALVRVSFAGFVAILSVVGIALMIRGNIFPWKLTPETSIMIGFIPIGSAILFGWIAAHPKWAYGEMALTGFLAYDLVLFVPYFELWFSRNDAKTITSYYGLPGGSSSAGDNGVNEVSLVIYLAVLIFTALLAVGMYGWRFARGSDYIQRMASRSTLAARLRRDRA